MSDCTEIGATLRRTREELGWSLQDVTHRTRIPLLTLHALEQDDYTVFASPTYTRSFLSQYSKHLGLDATDWLDTLETGDVFANLDSYEYLKDHDEHLSREPEEKPKARRQVSLVKTGPAPEERTPSQGIPMLQPLIVFAVTALMITGAVFGFLHLSRSLADSGDDAGEIASGPSSSDLKPVPNLADSSLGGQDLDAPRAVAVPSSSTTPALVVSAPPAEPTTSAPPRPAPPSVANASPPRDAAPPRAIIIEE